MARKKPPRITCLRMSAGGAAFMAGALAASAAHSCEKPDFSMTRAQLTVAQESLNEFLRDLTAYELDDDGVYREVATPDQLAPDGICGPKTRVAVEWWQRSEGFADDGNLDAAQFLFLHVGHSLFGTRVNYDVVLSLLENGVDPNARNKNGQSLLHVIGYPPAVSALLAAGADPNARDRYGQTPLHEANYFPETVTALLGAGADPNARSDVGRTPLHVINSTQAIEALLAAGADPDARTDAGRMPLHEISNPQSVIAMLDAGADPNALDYYGRTPLHYAGEPQAVTVLLDAGADPNARDNYGATPLFRTEVELGIRISGQKAAQAARTLLDAGADPNALDHYGDTPLDVARTARFTDDRELGLIETTLLDAGADPNARDNSGWTPTLDFARAEMILEDLLDAGVEPDRPASLESNEHRQVRFLCQAARFSDGRFWDRAVILEQLTPGNISLDPLIEQAPETMFDDSLAAEFRMTLADHVSLVSGTWNRDRSEVRIESGIGTSDYSLFSDEPVFIFESDESRMEIGLTPLRHRALEGDILAGELTAGPGFVCDETILVLSADRP